MKTVKTFRTEQEAVIYSLSLKELGIESTILKNDGGPYPTLTDIYGYSISVQDEDYQNAIDHLPKNMNVDTIENKEGSETAKPESNATEPAGRSWFLYGGFITGILATLLFSWVYSLWHCHYINRDIKHYYRYGEVYKIVKDRNHDGKDDLWEYRDDDGSVTMKQDNNYDGKADLWYERNGSIGIEKIDCDSNEIPDVTFYYVNNIVKKAFVHPNNDRRNVLYREYSPLGIIETEYVDTDSSGGFDCKRTFDPLGRLIKEEKIKDTVISRF